MTIRPTTPTIHLHVAAILPVLPSQLAAPQFCSTVNKQALVNDITQNPPGTLFTSRSGLEIFKLSVVLFLNGTSKEIHCTFA